MPSVRKERKSLLINHYVPKARPYIKYRNSVVPIFDTTLFFYYRIDLLLFGILSLGVAETFNLVPRAAGEVGILDRSRIVLD